MQIKDREREVFSSFISLKEHLIFLYKFLIEAAPESGEIYFENWDENSNQIGWSTPQNSLFIAASLQAVHTDHIEIDDASMYCRPAFDYDEAKNKFVAQYAYEVSRFMWVWVSFGQIVGNLTPDFKGGLHEKVLKLMQEPQFNYCFDSDQIVNFLEDICTQDLYSKALSKATNSHAIKLLPYFLCKEIRNSVFHSPMEEIEPTGYDEGEMYDVKYDERVVRFRIATRLVLLIVQDLLALNLCKNPPATSFDDDSDSPLERRDELSNIEIWRDFKSIHLRFPPSHSEQIELEI